MDKSTKKVLTIGGLGLAALGLWWYFGKNAGTASSSSTTAGEGLTTLPSASSTSQAVLTPRVIAWVNQHDNAWISQFNSVALPSMSQTDANNLDAIYNYWDQNLAPSVALGQWWNDFQRQYGLTNL